MEVTSSSKTMVPVYQTICCHISKDSGRLTAARTLVLLRYIFRPRKGEMTDKNTTKQKIPRQYTWETKHTRDT